MKQNSNTSQVPDRARRLTYSEAHDLGVRMLERLSRRTDGGGVLARVMRAIHSMHHQTVGAVDAAKTLAGLSPEDARRLTAAAAEIVHGQDHGGAR